MIGVCTSSEASSKDLLVIILTAIPISRFIICHHEQKQTVEDLELSCGPDQSDGRGPRYRQDETQTVPFLILHR